MEKCTHCDKKSNCHLNSSVLCDSHYNKEFKKNHIKDMIRHVINMISKKKESNFSFITPVFIKITVKTKVELYPYLSNFIV